MEKKVNVQKICSKIAPMQRDGKENGINQVFGAMSTFLLPPQQKSKNIIQRFQIHKTYDTLKINGFSEYNFL